MNETPTFQIPKDVIEPIIKAHVCTAITTALGGQAKLIEDVVARILAQKVDSEGKPSTYAHSSDVEFIQWACRNAVRVAVTSTLQEEMGKYKETLRKHIAAALQKKDSPFIKQLAEGMVSGVSNPDAFKWRLKVEVEK